MLDWMPGTVEQLAYSFAFIPPDISLWEYLTDKIYSRNTNTLLQDLNDVVSEDFLAILHELCAKPCANVSLQLRACSDADGKQVDYTMEK
ncbi:hypothetical protein X975_18408, partial [Stegodyphus mimosarum]